MAKKEIGYKGKTLEELQTIPLHEFIKLVPTRQRRSLTRGFTPAEKIFLQRVEQARAGKRKKPIKTQCRQMTIVPAMLGLIIHIYNGKEYTPIQITGDMLGRYLGEFAMTRKRVEHSAPGIGATKSSSALSVK